MGKFFILLNLLPGLLLSFTGFSQSSRLTEYLSERQWNELFPNRYNISTHPGEPGRGKNKVDFYSYNALVAAAKKFPLFLNEGSVLTQKRELAAFLANIALETGGGWDKASGGYYQWGLYFTDERGCEKGCIVYSDTSKKNYPPVAGQSYHGRGPLQLSWNYNYGQFSQAFLGNKDLLLRDPSLLTQDPVISFASALWFWMTAQTPKPSCHDIICNKWVPSAKDSLSGRLPGFGSVVNVINGGIECGTKQNDHVKYRYGYYLYFCKYLRITPGNNIECSTQKPFGQ
jgi:hypothetical protein